MTAWLRSREANVLFVATALLIRSVLFDEDSFVPPPTHVLCMHKRSVL